HGRLIRAMARMPLIRLATHAARGALPGIAAQVCA
ncbi:MAG: hypothetical protein ACJARE_003496, partial [Paracoccaceae bacterium]